MKRLVLRFLARLAEDIYIRAESKLEQAKSFHKASKDDLVAAMWRVKETRAIHERFQERMSQCNEICVKKAPQKEDKL